MREQGVIFLEKEFDEVITSGMEAESTNTTKEKVTYWSLSTTEE